MSLHETWRTIKYWEEIGGTLILEYPAVKGNKNTGKRLFDGIIIIDGERKIYNNKFIPVENKDIIVVQTKKNRLGMYLMGQAFFSREIMYRYNPKSVKTVAVCGKNDEELKAICEKYEIYICIITDDEKIDIENYEVHS